MEVKEMATLCVELRKETGLGIMVCKKILSENNWSIELAREYYYNNKDEVHERFCKRYI